MSIIVDPFPPERLTRCAMAVMAKPSFPGRVKTRLVPPLTPEQAADLNSCFLKDIVANILTAMEAVPIDGYFSIPDVADVSFFANLEPRFGCLVPKTTGLGASLSETVASLLSRGYGAVCLLNSDSPNLPVSILRDGAQHTLDYPDEITIGPALDGGYYLIGQSRLYPGLFEDIAWSTDRVLAQTLAKADALGLRAYRLPEWYDVDDRESLARLWQDLGGAKGNGASASVCYLSAMVRSGMVSLPDRSNPIVFQ